MLNAQSFFFSHSICLRNYMHTNFMNEINWKVCTCNFHLWSLVSVSFQFFWLCLNAWLFWKTFLLYYQGLQYYYLHQMLGVSDPDITFCPGNWDAGRWERDKMHLLIKDDTNCLLTLQRSSRKLLGYCWQLFRSRKWTVLRRKRASQVWDSYPSPSFPPSRCSQLQTGSQEHKRAQEMTGARRFVMKMLAKLTGSRWQVLSNPVIVIHICWRNSFDTS